MAVRIRVVRWLAPLCLVTGLLPLAAAGPAEPAPTAAPTDARGWLTRIHNAAVSAQLPGHDGLQQRRGCAVQFAWRTSASATRPTSASRRSTGKQRQVYRHNDLVHTVWPQAGLAVIERRRRWSACRRSRNPSTPARSNSTSCAPRAATRVAGRETVVFLLQPRDELALRPARVGRSRHRADAALRRHRAGSARGVLESAAFSEVEIGVRAQPESVLQPMRQARRLRVLRPAACAPRAGSRGLDAGPAGGRASAWPVASSVRPMQRPAGGEAPEVLQAVFSDGLTHVSLFIEPYDAEHHRKRDAGPVRRHRIRWRRGDHWITVDG
jgi:sigma-E factor negative regulatory protein RseB